VLSVRAADTSFQNDPAEYYGSRFLLAVIFVGAALILYSLFRLRGRLQGSASWLLLILGVVVLPAISTMLGTLLVFERAERVEFCGSCHKAMQAYVDDMNNPKSESLAAIHYRNRYVPRNQCYTCHTSFGLFGTVQAKIAGVIDVHKYYTGTFRREIRMRAPYGNEDCLKCHAGAVKWSVNHVRTRDGILAGKTTCLGCHGVAHPAHSLNRQAQNPG
jgi:nitrate/TMAO reductase-like tetraheme cytochrome c subunit